MGPYSILGSFDARRAHGTQWDAQGFKEHYAGNTSTDTNVKEHTRQVAEPSQPTVITTTQTDVPLTVQLESPAAPLGSSVSGGSVEMRGGPDTTATVAEGGWGPNPDTGGISWIAFARFYQPCRGTGFPT
jgi:hypothetical protein